MLVLTIVVVFVVEMLNTAMEFVVDLVTTEYHPLAKLAKDVSAGAVLVSSVGAVVVGLPRPRRRPRPALRPRRWPASAAGRAS